MTRIRPAEQILRQLAINSRQPYVCRSCRAQAIRQIHTSPISRAELPFFKRIQNSLFGSKESQAVEKSQEEKQQKRYEEVAEREGTFSDVEIRTDSRGREYEVAALVDTLIDKNYVPATNWDGLERIGSQKWVEEMADRGDAYTGYVLRVLQLYNAY